MEIKLFRDLDLLAKGKSEFIFTFEGKDKEKFKVKVLKKKYPKIGTSSNSKTVYEAYFIFLTKDGKDLNGAGFEEKNTKVEIIERIKEKMLNFGFKDNSKDNSNSFNPEESKLSLDLEETNEEITNPNNFNLKTLADIKRLPVGTFMRRLLTPKKDSLGTFTKIQSKITNGFNLTFDEKNNVTSRLDFPQSKYIEIKGNKIFFYDDRLEKRGPIELIYELYKDEGLSLKEMEEKYKNQKIIDKYTINDIEAIQTTFGNIFITTKKGKEILFGKISEITKLGEIKKKENYIFLKEDRGSFFRESAMLIEFKRGNKVQGQRIPACLLWRDSYKLLNEIPTILYSKKYSGNVIEANSNRVDMLKEDTTKIFEGTNYGPTIMTTIERKEVGDLIEAKTEKETDEEEMEELKRKEIKEGKLVIENSRSINDITEEKVKEFIKKNNFKLVKGNFEYQKTLKNKNIIVSLSYYGKDKAYIILKKRKWIDIDKKEFEKANQEFHNLVLDLKRT